MLVLTLVMVGLCDCRANDDSLVRLRATLADCTTRLRRVSWPPASYDVFSKCLGELGVFRETACGRAVSTPLAAAAPANRFRQMARTCARAYCPKLASAKLALCGTRRSASITLDAWAALQRAILAQELPRYPHPDILRELASTLAGILGGLRAKRRPLPAGGSLDGSAALERARQILRKRAGQRGLVGPRGSLRHLTVRLPGPRNGRGELARVLKSAGLSIRLDRRCLAALTDGGSLCLPFRVTKARGRASGK